MNKKGFTLIEMLVVVLIIGILAAIALPQYQHVVDNSRYAALMNVTKAIADANERFYLVNNRYSTKFKELDIDVSANRIEGGDAYFDWGNCHLLFQQEVQCTNDTTLKNQFIKLYDNSTSSNLRGGFFCTATGVEENTRQDKICKSIGEYLYSSLCLFPGNSWIKCRLYVVRR